MSEPRQPEHPEHYSLWQMAMLIAERVRRPDETLRQAADKARKRLVHAVAKGDLTLAQTQAGQPGPVLRTSDAVLWARGKHPGEFLDIPVSSSVRLVEALGVADSASGQVLPGDLQRCQQALREAYERIERLDQLLDATLTEYGRVAPLAERYERNRAKNQASARKPRKGV